MFPKSGQSPSPLCQVHQNWPRFCQHCSTMCQFCVKAINHHHRSTYGEPKEGPKGSPEAPWGAPKQPQGLPRGESRGSRKSRKSCVFDGFGLPQGLPVGVRERERERERPAERADSKLRKERGGFRVGGGGLRRIRRDFHHLRGPLARKKVCRKREITF